MKTEDIRTMSDADLENQLDADRRELFNLRFQLATRKTKNHQRIPQVKREIARILTVLRERELMVLYGGAEAEEVVEHAPAGGIVGAARPTGARRSLLGRLRGGNKQQ